MKAAPAYRLLVLTPEETEMPEHKDPAEANRPNPIEKEDLTSEVGSEGGGPGTSTKPRPDERPLRGGESTETVKGRGRPPHNSTVKRLFGF